MANFKVRVGFSGVCSFIINSNINRRVRACVVLPDAEGRGVKHHTSKKAPDGQRLLRHRAYIRFKLQQLVAITDKSAVQVDSEGIAYIEGFRVSFKIPNAECEANPFKTDPSFRNHLLSMEEVAGVYADDFKDIVARQPDQKIVTSQILIDSGTLKHDPQADDPPLATWIVPNNLNGKVPPLSKALAHEMALELLNISDLVVLLEPLGAGTPSQIKLAPVAAEPVEITISHLCSDGNPLRWKMTDPPEQKDDLDFKWHYMLFSQATRDSLTTNLLGGLPLPVPIPRFQTAAQGANCPPFNWEG